MGYGATMEERNARPPRGETQITVRYTKAVTRAEVEAAAGDARRSAAAYIRDLIEADLKRRRDRIDAGIALQRLVELKKG